MEKRIDTAEELIKHSKILKGKHILNNLYVNFYSQLYPTGTPTGKIVELGSGAGFVKEVIPDVITSDVIKGPGIDKVFYAEKMPFKSNSISSFVMIDVLHHIKDPEKAFKEMQRCLKVGGKIIMIEPYKSLWGYIIYKYLHYEHFDPKSGWKVKGKGRMSDSNTAIPWIIFVRDRKIFEKKFPKLKINKIEGHTPFLYLLSGGLTKPQFIPSSMYPLAKFIEKMISPLNKYLGMFVTIELQKVK